MPDKNLRLASKIVNIKKQIQSTGFNLNFSILYCDETLAQSSKVLFDPTPAKIEPVKA
jgi:hypothetical protein